MYAHYFASSTHRYLFISASPAPTFGTAGEEIQVSGKVEARRIAKARGARCWNF